MLINLLEALASVMTQAVSSGQRGSLWRHAHMVRRAGQRLPEPDDRDDLERRFQKMVETFGGADRVR